MRRYKRAFSDRRVKNDFTFWRTFGLSSNLGLGDSLSELARKWNDPVPLQCKLVTYFLTYLLTYMRSRQIKLKLDPDASPTRLPCRLEIVNELLLVSSVMRNVFLFHDLLVLDLEQVFEVLLDRCHGVFVTDDVGGLLSDHHLRRVRVAAQRARYHRRVDDSQVLQTAYSAQTDGRRVQQLTGLIGLSIGPVSYWSWTAFIVIHRTKWQRLSAGDTLRS